MSATWLARVPPCAQAIRWCCRSLPGPPAACQAPPQPAKLPQEPQAHPGGTGAFQRAPSRLTPPRAAPPDPRGLESAVGGGEGGQADEQRAQAAAHVALARIPPHSAGLRPPRTGTLPSASGTNEELEETWGWRRRAFSECRWVFALGAAPARAVLLHSRATHLHHRVADGHLGGRRPAQRRQGDEQEGLHGGCEQPGPAYTRCGWCTPVPGGSGG